MFKRLIEFFLMMTGISSTDEETKQRRERERWERQKRLAEQGERPQDHEAERGPNRSNPE